jgi:hypothetical protein
VSKPKTSNSPIKGNPDKARELAERSHASRRANRDASTNANPGATPNASDGYTSAVGVAAAGMAGAVGDVLRELPPTARFRISRVAPAWCRGYLEEIDASTVRAGGGMHRYLADTWGGNRYSIELLDVRDKVAPWTIEIVGDVRSYGAPVAAPTPVRAEMPPPYLPPAAPAGAAPGALGELAAAVAQLGRNQAAIAESLERVAARVQAPPPAPAPNPSSSPPFASASATIAQLRESVQAARELADDLAELSPKPAPAPPPAPVEPDRGISGFAKRTVERLVDRAIDQEFQEAAREARAGGNGGNGSQPAGPVDAGAGDDVVEAESVGQ